MIQAKHSAQMTHGAEQPIIVTLSMNYTSSKRMVLSCSEAVRHASHASPGVRYN